MEYAYDSDGKIIRSCISLYSEDSPLDIESDRIDFLCNAVGFKEHILHYGSGYESCKELEYIAVNEYFQFEGNGNMTRYENNEEGIFNEDLSYYEFENSIVKMT